MSDDEMAAFSVALYLMNQQNIQSVARDGDDHANNASRWKLASRRPELGLEDVRAL